MQRAFAVVATLMVLSACDRDDRGDARDSSLYGGAAVIGYLAEPSSMNEFASVDANSDELQSFVLFTTLIQYDAELRPQPYLAESWDTAAAGDDLILTFRLRRDVKWHDGTLTTAFDVEFTVDRIKQLGNSFPHASAFADYDSAVAIDSFTVALYLKRHPGFMDPWRFTSPMPKHILGDVPLAELQEHPFGTASPVGNGPFRFVKHVPGDRWVFEAAPDFPEALGGRPYLDRWIYRIIPEPTTMLTGLLSGELDVYLGIVPEQFGRVASSPGVDVIVFPTRRYVFINWNERREPFSDVRVRRALTLGIDRGRMIEAVRHGLGEVANSPVPPYHWAHDAELAPLGYDPEAARALLDAAGWRDADGDGVRERGDRQLSFELLTNTNPVREDILVIVQSDLAKIGIAVRPRVMEAQTMATVITGPERDFDAFVLGWGPQFLHDDRQFFSCTMLDNPFQWSGYCDRRVDEILGRLASLDDRNAALPLWYECQEIIQSDQPYTFLYFEVQPNGVRHRLHNVQMDIRGNLINAKDWWIEPGARRSVTAADIN